MRTYGEICKALGIKDPPAKKYSPHEYRTEYWRNYYQDHKNDPGVRERKQAAWRKWKQKQKNKAGRSLYQLGKQTQGRRQLRDGKNSFCGWDGLGSSGFPGQRRGPYPGVGKAKKAPTPGGLEERLRKGLGGNGRNMADHDFQPGQRIRIGKPLIPGTD